MGVQFYSCNLFSSFIISLRRASSCTCSAASSSSSAILISRLIISLSFSCMMPWATRAAESTMACLSEERNIILHTSSKVVILSLKSSFTLEVNHSVQVSRDMVMLNKKICVYNRNFNFYGFAKVLTVCVRFSTSPMSRNTMSSSCSMRCC